MLEAVGVMSAALTVSAASFEYQLAHIHDDNSRTSRVICILGIILATAAVVGRLCSRRLAGAPLMVDDWTIIAALVRPWPLPATTMES